MNAIVDKSEFRIWVEGVDAFAVCASDERVLDALERNGCVAVRAGCRRGGCGACRVRVLSGTYDALKMSRAHVSVADEKQGYALSCRLLPKSDMVLEPAYVGPKLREDHHNF